MPFGFAIGGPADGIALMLDGSFKTRQGKPFFDTVKRLRHVLKDHGSVSTNKIC